MIAIIWKNIRNLRENYVLTALAGPFFCKRHPQTKNAHNPPCNRREFPGSGKTGLHKIKIPPGLPGVQHLRRDSGEKMPGLVQTDRKKHYTFTIHVQRNCIFSGVVLHPVLYKSPESPL